MASATQTKSNTDEGYPVVPTSSTSCSGSSRNRFFCQEAGGIIQPWGDLETTTLVKRVASYFSNKDRYKLLPTVCRGFRAQVGSWSPKTIMVGSHEFAQEITEVVMSLGLPRFRVGVDTLVSEGALVWSRDYRVTLHDGTQLFPYTIVESFYQEKMKLFLLHMPDEMLDKLQGGHGTSISDSTRDDLIKQAKKKGCKWKNSRVVIEGGNCRITRNKYGESVAIIGESSLIFSMLALEEQGYFSENQETVNLLASKELPAICIFQARVINARLKEHSGKAASKLAEIFGTPSDVEPSYYWETLSSSLSEEERSMLTSASSSCEALTLVLARDIAAKLRLTKKVIAAELRLPEKNIAFLPQLEWHVDMDVTPLPRGCVLVNETSAVMKALEAWNQPKDHRREILSRFKFVREVEQSWGAIDDKETVIATDRMLTNGESTGKVRDIYYAVAKARLPIYAPLERERSRLLTSIGCEPIAVPGVYAGNGHVFSLNFMNAIVLETERGFSYITNGAPRSCAYLQNIFEKALPPCRFGAIRDTRVLISFYQGGIHCLHWMH